MSNDMTPAVAAEILEKLIDMMKDGYCPPYFCGDNAAALPLAASVLRKLERGELVPVVKCSQCCKWHTPDCHAGHEQAAADYCSHGTRKDDTP